MKTALAVILPVLVMAISAQAQTHEKLEREHEAATVLLAAEKEGREHPRTLQQCQTLLEEWNQNDAEDDRQHAQTDWFETP
jgi:hypothetical protein